MATKVEFLDPNCYVRNLLHVASVHALDMVAVFAVAQWATDASVANIEYTHPAMVKLESASSTGRKGCGMLVFVRALWSCCVLCLCCG